ncbi:MAG: hypothetical protein HGN29_03540 [Asgard group archaeon]|nr:hypothetical protein [Asgard group archaeon]
MIFSTNASDKGIQIKNMILDSVETWTVTEVISNGSDGGSYEPSVTLDSFGNAYVFWLDYSDDYLGSGSDPDIFLKFWNETTKTWKTSLVTTESWDGIYGLHCDVDSKDNIHLAWSENSNIWYKYWNVTSQTWNETSEITTESNGGIHPFLVVDSADNIHIAWSDSNNYDGSGYDRDIFYKFWNATTQTWNTTTVISIGSTDSSGGYGHSMAIDSSGNVHIAWTDSTDNYYGGESVLDIFHRFWNITDQSWSSISLLSIGSTDLSHEPSLVADSLGNIHLAWFEYTQDYYSSGKDYGIYYKIWNATTISWNSPIILDNEFDSSAYPRLAIDSADNIHVAFYSIDDYDGAGDSDSDIFYKKWDSTLKLWTSTTLISTESPESHHLYHSIATNDIGDVSIAWADKSNFDNCGTDTDVFYKKLGFLPSPVLNEITPYPSTTGDINLAWNAVPEANSYHIYRSNTFITSVNVLTPIATTIAYSYVDLNLPNGYYYYVVIASSDIINSSLSNVVSIGVILPEVNEFPLVTSIFLFGIISICTLTIILRRRKKRD